MKNAAGAALRLSRLLLHTLGGFMTIRLRFAGLAPAAREQCVQRWAADMLERLGVTLVRQGQPMRSGPLLIVANHISWLDILVLHASGYSRFVAKAEVRRWPLLGALASGAGTLYIERASRRDALRVVHHMAESFQRGEVVAAFPEGTTGDGTELLPFHANLLQAALATRTPVQPAGLRYVDALTGAPSHAPCYRDGETLLQSLWRTLTAPQLVAVLTFGAPQSAPAHNRRLFAAELRAEVDRLRRAPVEAVAGMSAAEAGTQAVGGH